MLAECFQFIVDTGQLRIAAVHQHGIIITDDSQILRNPQLHFTGVFQSTQCQRIVSSNDTVEGDSLCMQLQQLVCHSGNIFMRSLIELQEASVGQKSFFLHGGTVTGQLFLTTVRSGVVEVQDVFHSGTDHFHGGIIHGSKIIRYDAVNIGSVHGCIQQHHRHLCGSAEDVFVVIFLLVDKIGTY